MGSAGVLARRGRRLAGHNFRKSPPAIAGQSDFESCRGALGAPHIFDKWVERQTLPFLTPAASARYVALQGTDPLDVNRFRQQNEENYGLTPFSAVFYGLSSGNECRGPPMEHLGGSPTFPKV